MSNQVPSRPLSSRAWRSLALWLVRRVANVALVMFMISASLFVLLTVAGADAAALVGGEEGATAEQIDAARARFGLDRPLVVQYLDWAWHALQGDFGESWRNDRPVTDLITSRVPVTVSLTVATVVLAVPFALVLGVLAGSRDGRLTDRIISAAASVAIAVPTFFTGILLAVFLAVRWGWFPATGYVSLTEDPADFLRHIFLPAVALAVPLAAQLLLQLRGSLSTTLAQDYVTSAEARGLSWRRVLGKHALKNAAIPPVTLLGVRIIQLVGGTIIVESIFAMPGLGTLGINSVLARDLPTLQGIVVLTALFGLVINLVIEAVYRLLDPRIKAVTR